MLEGKVQSWYLSLGFPVAESRACDILGSQKQRHGEGREGQEKELSRGVVSAGDELQPDVQGALE